MQPVDIDSCELDCDFFYHSRKSFMDYVTEANRTLSELNILALTDLGGLSGKPMLYVVENDPRHIYILNDFAAAATAVGKLAHNVYPFRATPACILTENRLVPVNPVHTSDSETETMRRAVGSAYVGLSASAAVKRGIFTKALVATTSELGIGTDRKIARFPPDPVAVVPVATWTRDGGAKIVNKPAYQARGFIEYNVSDESTLEVVVGRIYKTYDKIAHRVGSALLRVILPGALLSDPLNERRNIARSVIANIKMGLVAVTVEAMGNLSTQVNISNARNFASAVMCGSVSTSEFPLEETVRGLVGMLSFVWSRSPVWRGFGVILPVPFIGFGAFNKSSKYLNESSEEHKHVWSDMQIGILVTGMLAGGISIHTSQEEFLDVMCRAYPTKRFPQFVFRESVGEDCLATIMKLRRM
jgi:hypothetical protein